MVWFSWGRLRSKALAIGTAGLCLAFADGAQAQTQAGSLEQVRAENEPCLGCHSEAGFSSGAHARIPRQDIAEHFVDPAVFEKSNHGKVACVTCHVTGFASFPHIEKPSRQTNTCADCHARIVLRIEEQFLKSVHERKLPKAFTCTTCHDPHVFIHEKKFSLAREIVRQDNGMCLQCHADPERFARMTKTAMRDLHAIHHWLPNADAHWAAVRCVECHTAAPQRVLSHEILAASGAERNCVACHSVDSALRVRLYRHLVAEEREQAGFLNSVIMNEAYVIGATRNRYLDLASLLLLGAVAGGIALHGAARIVAALIRRRRGHV